MINIAVLTATRAEYGLMRQLLFALNKDEDFKLNLLVTGTHLSAEHGMTINEIIDDNLPIAHKIDINVVVDGKIDTALTMSRATTLFAELFKHEQYDCLLVDGDRYETVAVCIAAILNNIPIIHCGGGATTEGANDEYWRHMITKLSSVHFPTMEIYKKRILQMGENPEMVFVVGSMGLENIRVMKMEPIEALEKKVGLDLSGQYAVVTFHPVTMETNTAGHQITELLMACEECKDMSFIFTKANADKDGEVINQIISDFVKKHPDRFALVSSLGAKLYLSALNRAYFVLGNSSSGLIEAPSFKIPTINVGDRQKGREKASSVIDCEPVKNDILKAIEIAKSEEFREKCKHTINPNGDGYTCQKIIKHLKELYKENKISTVKKFYDFGANEQ